MTIKVNASPHGELAPVGLTPAQVQSAYQFDQISFQQRLSNGKYTTLSGNDLGKGMTIAIVDAYNNPSIMGDIQTFSQQFGLPQFNQSNGTGKPYSPTFKILNQNGKTSPLPRTELSTNFFDTGWAGEIALDVEWVHAIAPAANIVLVLATNNLTTNLLKAVDTARKLPGVVAVSNSWGSTAIVQTAANGLPVYVGAEFLGEGSADSVFTTPAGHAGVSFIASAGDDGGPSTYPSSSPNVLSVGGTTLALDPVDNSWVDETVWNNFTGAGGGGQSAVLLGSTSFITNTTEWELFPIQQVPNYQRGLGLVGRGTPDVSYNADPITGFATYSSYAFQGWASIGGTSAGAPQWAALIAIANQGRKLKGKAMLSNVQSIMYKLPATDFHDVTVGNNDLLSPSYPGSGLGLGLTGNEATEGYDLASGRGTPIANLVVRDLVNFNGSTFVASSRVNAPKNNSGVWYFFSKPPKIGPSFDSLFAGPGLPTLGSARLKNADSLDTVASSVTASTSSDLTARGTEALTSDRAAAVDRVLLDAKLGDVRVKARSSMKFSGDASSSNEAIDSILGKLEKLSAALAG
jgi:subtilase family serine protease